MRTIFCLLPFLFFAQLQYCQVKGLVTDQNGEPLPFASVYVLGTTEGTTTNPEGEYFLDLEEGDYQLVFQYVGFGQQIISVNYNGNQLTLNVKLAPEAISLNEIEIKANAEDPAYPIIRKAIEKRKYYKEQVPSYSCDVYIKGNVKILDAPEKILGQEIGDMEGSLDSNRQGIVYLSESVSKLYFKQPDQFKEVMTSSKVSGNDNGFSFNSAQDMDIDLYRNFTEYGRNVISPIAEGAMGFYRYRLEGVLVDEEGRFVNKIEIIPKRQEDPTYHGFIYIVDKLWNIQSTDIYLTGNSVQMPLFDTLYIKQTYVPVAEPDIWRIFSRTFSISGGAFGFKFGGVFTGIYTGYDLDPSLNDKFFNNEVMKVEEGANEKDSSFWNQTRPVPLTIEEEKDYVVKDSVQVVRESKPYLDSMDQKNNKLNVGSILFGYTHRNSWKRRSFTLESPINTFQFNTVQGFNIRLGINYKKAFDKERNKRLEVGGRLNYGFSDEVLRGTAKFQFNYNPKKFSRLRVIGGRDLAQYNEAEPISLMLNTYYSLFSRRNYARFYDKKFLQVNHIHEVTNGFLLYVVGQYAQRSPLDNNSGYSFFNKDREYEPNIPENNHIIEGGLASSRALQAGISVRLRAGQKYFNYPDRKYIAGTKFPDLWIHYRKGISIQPGSSNALRSDVGYDRISVVVQKRRIKIGLGGFTSFRLDAGKFFNREKMFFQDYKHFLGNEIGIGNSEMYFYAFKNLPYYEYSTRDSWFAGHWEHNFQGFITDKIPLLNKLDWNLVASAKFLYTSEMKDYAELSIGFDNIGFGILRLFRFDVTASFMQGNYDRLGFLIGVNLPIEDFQVN